MSKRVTSSGNTIYSPDGAGMMVSFDLEGVDDLASDLAAGSVIMSQMLDTAVLEAGDAAVRAMQSDHFYTDRTYLLTAGMTCKPFGRRSKTSAEAIVTFKAKYAKFVNDGTAKSKPYPFIPTGIAAAGPTLEAYCSQAIGAFCRRASE